METGFSHDRFAERREVREENDREEEEEGREEGEVDDEWTVGSRPILVAERRREEEEEDRDVVVAKTSLEDRGSMIEKGKGRREGGEVVDGKEGGEGQERDRITPAESSFYLISIENQGFGKGRGV